MHVGEKRVATFLLVSPLPVSPPLRERSHRFPVCFKLVLSPPSPRFWPRGFYIAIRGCLFLSPSLFQRRGCPFSPPFGPGRRSGHKKVLFPPLFPFPLPLQGAPPTLFPPPLPHGFGPASGFFSARFDSLLFPFRHARRRCLSPPFFEVFRRLLEMKIETPFSFPPPEGRPFPPFPWLSDAALLFSEMVHAAFPPPPPPSNVQSKVSSIGGRSTDSPLLPSFPLSFFCKRRSPLFHFFSAGESRLFLAQQSETPPPPPFFQID